MDSGQDVDVVKVMLGSAVAKNGTIVFPYPAGRALASYITSKAELYSRGLMAQFSIADAGITASFGASSVTVTYKGETSIPAGTEVSAQLHLASAIDNLVPLADPSTATTTQIGTLLNQVVAALKAL